MWTKFMDMFSGGFPKEQWQYIYIEAPEKEAAVIFYNRFGHSPFRMTCTCCGEDYSLTESETLQQVTAYERGCGYNSEDRCYIEAPDPGGYQKYTTLEDYRQDDSVLFIYAEDIKPEEREGHVPAQGFIWVE